MADALARAPGFGAAYGQRRGGVTERSLSGSRRFLKSGLNTFRRIYPNYAHAADLIAEPGAKSVAFDDLQNGRGAGQADDECGMAGHIGNG